MSGAVEGARLGKGGRGERTHADAAWRPRPREPPVTTATLPLSEKREGKSLRSTSVIVSVELSRERDGSNG